MSYRIFFVAVFTYSSVALCQENTLFFNTIEDEDYLSDNEYNDFISQDKEDFIWISSINGLNRYDGLSIKIYPRNEEELDTFIGKNIQSRCYEDLNGNLWFSTYYGLVKYNRKSDSFHSFQFTLDKVSKIKEDYHVFYIEKANDILWLKAGKKIISYDINDDKIKEILPFESEANRFSILINNKEEVISIYSHSASVKYSEIFEKNRDYEWTKQINKDRTNLRVMNSLDEERQLLSDLMVTLRDKDTILLPNRIKHIQMINRNQFLLASEYNGWYLFESINKTISNFEKISDKEKILRTFYIDSLRNIWFAYQGEGVGYSYVPHYSASFISLNFEERKFKFKSILEDENESIWISSKFEGIFQYDIDAKLIREFPVDIFRSENQPDFIQFFTSYVSRPVAITKNNVFLYDEKKKKWKYLLEKEKEKLLFISSLRNGRILISSDQKGMLELRDSLGEYVLTQAKEFQGIEGTKFTRVFEGKNYIFTPFNSKELWIFRQEDNDLVKIKSLPLTAEFYNFCEISGKTLFATSRGVLELNQETLELQNFDEELNKAIGRHTPYDSLEDKNGDLWIPTNKTLIRYNLEKKEAAIFRKEDGFVSTEFSDYMKNLVASDGKIWLGTNKGVVVFHPDSIQPYPYPPNPYIDGLKINNEPYQGEIVVGEADAITLDYTQNTLELDLLAIGYYLPKESTVEYQMLNYEDKVNSTLNGTTIRYTQVPPGDYVFQYTAINVNGLRSEPKSLRITITPPFWQTTWFRILEILALLGLFYIGSWLYVRYKTREQRIEAKKQEEVEKVRGEIRSDLHDSVGSSLSMIYSKSKQVENQTNDADLLSELNEISSYANDSIQHMNTILAELKSNHYDLDELIDSVRKKAFEYTKNKDLKYEFKVPNDLSEIGLDNEQEWNIFAILNEGLHNIMKYAEPNHFSIEVSIKDNYINIFIKDDGKGFNIRSTKDHGLGLKNMRNRTKTIGGIFRLNSEIGRGTTIKARIPIKKTKGLRNWLRK